MKTWTILIAWILILLSIVYVYYFHPEFFNHIFEYQGPGSPYVNTPSND